MVRSPSGVIRQWQEAVGAPEVLQVSSGCTWLASNSSWYSLQAQKMVSLGPKRVSTAARTAVQ